MPRELVGSFIVLVVHRVCCGESSMTETDTETDHDLECEVCGSDDPITATKVDGRRVCTDCRDQWRETGRWPDIEPSLSSFGESDET